MFDMDPDIESKVEKDAEVVGMAMDVAEAIAAHARSTAPVGTGAYEGGIHAEKTAKGARVFSSDPKSAWIEFGAPSRGLPAHFNLRTAAKALGYKFKKGH